MCQQMSPTDFHTNCMSQNSTPMFLISNVKNWMITFDVFFFIRVFIHKVRVFNKIPVCNKVPIWLCVAFYIPIVDLVPTAVIFEARIISNFQRLRIFTYFLFSSLQLIFLTTKHITTITIAQMTEIAYAACTKITHYKDM